MNYLVEINALKTRFANLGVTLKQMTAEAAAIRAAVVSLEKTMNSRLSDLDARIRPLEAQGHPPAVTPTDWTTFTVDFSSVGTEMIGRFQRFVYNDNSDDPNTLVSRACSSIDATLAGGGGTWAFWDCKSSSYDGDTRGASAPDGAFKAIFDYGRAKDLRVGILVPNRFTRPDYSTDVPSYKSYVLECIRYHRDTFGCTFFYLDANPADNPAVIQQIAALLEDDRLAGAPRVILLIENSYKSREGGAGDTADAFSRVALVWDGLDQAWDGDPYWTPRSTFGGRVCRYTTHLGNLSGGEQTSLAAWSAANPGRWVTIADCWYGYSQPPVGWT